MSQRTASGHSLPRHFSGWKVQWFIPTSGWVVRWTFNFPLLELQPMATFLMLPP